MEIEAISFTIMHMSTKDVQRTTNVYVLGAISNDWSTMQLGSQVSHDHQTWPRTFNGTILGESYSNNNTEKSLFVFQERNKVIEVW